VRDREGGKNSNEEGWTGGCNPVRQVERGNWCNRRLNWKGRLSEIQIETSFGEKKNENESDLKPKKEIRLTVEWRKSDGGTK